MKLNQVVLLSLTSFLVGITPISFAVAAQVPISRAVQPTVGSLVVAQASSAIASGTFQAGEAPTTGTARIVTESGHRYLELDAAFSTSNMGPDLHVLLDSATQPPQSYDNLGSAVNLGKLHDFSGAQRYPIPDAIDLANFRTVVVWCRMANATFGYAPLSPIMTR
jgi:Electron transfer DM13